MIAAEIVHVATHVVIVHHQARIQGSAERYPLYHAVATGQQFARAAFDAGGEIGVRRTAVVRIVFEAAVGGRVVGRGDYNSVGQARAAALVPGQNGMGHGGRGRKAAPGLDPNLHAVGCQHFQSGAPGGFGQGVGVFAQKQGTGHALGPTHVAHGLGDGQNVRFVEAGVQRRAAVAGGAERDFFSRAIGIGGQGIIGSDQGRNVDQALRAGQPACVGVERHGVTPG